MKSKKKIKKRVILAVVAVVLVVALVLAVVRFGQRGQMITQDLTENTIRSAAVTTGSISNSVSGSGTLTSAESQKITVPDGVEIETVEVSAGDQVKVGDLLATADRDSILTALAEAQSELESLDEQLSETEDDTVSSTIQAGVSGRVKAIWAEVGDSVSAVTAEQGGLLLLSLDGTMSVELPASDAVAVGDTVVVTLSDGDTEEGTVESVTDSAVTVTLTDNGPEYGDTVTVATEEGDDLGSGTLDVHSPLLITGYTGTVSSVKVSVNQKVSSGTTLFKLEDLGHTAEYNALLVQRQAQAERIQALTALYQDNQIVATFDGTVQTVEVDTSGTSTSSTTQSNATPYTTASSNISDTGMVVLLSATVSEDDGTTLTEEEQSSDTEGSADGADAAQDTQESADTETEQEVTPASVTIEAQIALEGGQLSDYSGAFTLSLSGEGNTQQKTNDATGKVTFDTLTFDTAGSYVYRLYQTAGSDSQITYDTTLYTLTINVTEQDGVLQAEVVSGQEQLLFTNQLTTDETQEAQEDQEQTAQAQTGTSAGQSGSMSGFSASAYSGSSSGLSKSSESSGSSVSASSESTATSSSSSTESENNDVTVLTISPDDTMTVSVSVDELDILSIAKGQEASVTVDALEGDPITGTVTGIDTTGSSSGGVTKYTVEVTVEKTDEMLANMNASVEIVISETDDSLVIPEAALQQDGASTYVYTAYDEESGTLSGEVEVTTGISDGTTVEIADGLSEGDVVYYSYTEASNSASGLADMDMSGMSMDGFSRGDFPGGGAAEGGMPSGGMPSGGMPGGQS